MTMAISSSLQMLELLGRTFAAGMPADFMLAGSLGLMGLTSSTLAASSVCRLRIC